MNKETLMKSNSWPIQEAIRILDKINWKTPEKGYVLFETGYGPSGLPHIGTFGEVVRTKMVMFAFSLLAPEIPTRIFCVSDDIDGMRKIPDNVPNKEELKKYLGLPLTSVPDPYGTHKSYGHNMNSRLCKFLDDFGFEYEFLSATDCYKNGMFDEYLIKCAENYQKLMDIMIPTLGEERQETYSPFMPIDIDTGKVVAEGVKKVDPINKTIHYKDENGNEKEVIFTGGGCKLQWKCDFGMRWAALDVDYEIYGKDHYPNEPVYRAICEALGKTPPVNFFYELFLDNEGKKISKSKGNGVTVDEWIKYAPQETLAYYMFLKPKTAKRLYFDVIPRSVDEYIRFCKSYHQQNEEQRLENPVYFVHFGKNIPEMKFDLSFSLLTNLASACNPEDNSIMWGFIQKYDENLRKGHDKFLDAMVERSILYYNDFVKPNKVYRNATDQEKRLLSAFIDSIKGKDELKAEDIQNLAYNVCTEAKIDSKVLFTAIYEVVLGLQSGPRIGSFVQLFGVQKFCELVYTNNK